MEGQRQDRQRVAVPPLSSREAVFDRWPPPRLSGSAESEVRSGRADLTLALLERLITEVRASGLRWQEAELLRVSGEARLLGSPPIWTALAALWRQPAPCHANRARVPSSRAGCVFGEALSIERPGLGSACRTRARARRLRTNNRLAYGRRSTGAIRYVGLLGQRHLTHSDPVRGFEDSGIRALRPMRLVLATQSCSRLRYGRYRSLAGAGLTRIDACNVAGLT
jgi:hypothetical protein